MKIIKKISELQKLQKKLEISGEKTCFIPTMGALHDGHMSLIDEARKIPEFSGKILVSIFVNPLQFENAGQSEDFSKYPNTLDADIEELKNSGVDILFLPEISEVYPEKNNVCRGVLHAPEMLPEIFSELEGENRKGHFDGVFQVVKRLFEIVKPRYAVFGQKDFQQVMLIQYLQKKYFNTPENKISIITAPLFREKSGLAYSSRNMRFSEEEKSRAVVLFHALSEMKKIFWKYQRISEKISGNDVRLIGQKILESEKYIQNIHYISIRDAETFSEISEAQTKKYPQSGDIILISVEFAGIHLIDNMIL